MAATARVHASRRVRSRRPPAVRFTLLDLVRAVSEVTSNEKEVVETIRHLLDTGRVRLCGNFRGQRFTD